MKLGLDTIAMAIEHSFERCCYNNCFGKSSKTYTKTAIPTSSLLALFISNLVLCIVAA